MRKTIIATIALSKCVICYANSCSIVSQANLNFNCGLSFAACQAIGNVQFLCTQSSNYTITLNQGNSGTFTQRTLVNQSNSNYKINYNIYTTPARITVLGDGGQGSGVVSGTCINSCTVNFYGYISSSIPKTPWAGSYSDTLNVFINLN